MMRPLYWIYGTLFAAFYSVIIYWPMGSLNLIQDYGVFFVLGLLGALVANSTGAGGGVIFIPFFASIGFSSIESVGTSMAIQCFGMTAGAISWLNTIQNSPTSFSCNLPVIHKMLWFTGASTIIGMLAGQYFIPDPMIEASEIFRWFSIIFGVILFLYTWKTRGINVEETHNLTPLDSVAMSGTCIIGGVITSWISVGVGEIIALLLFFRGFSPALAVAVGVYTSAIAVLCGIIHHIIVLNSISLEVLLFAGQAALIGGYLARHITQKLGSFYLKLFFAVWIFASGVFID